jgi:transposase
MGAQMTDAEILTLVDRLERCLLAKEEFHHRDHLTVAVAYLHASDLESAMDRMRSSLKRFAAHHSVPKLYHETLTRFWLLQVERHLDRSECLEQSVRKVREQLSDKNLAFGYYSHERIESKEARENWLEPDLKEL